MPAAASPPATILIVDDDRGLSRLIEKTLAREGFSTASSASGREAIDWIATHDADLMLLDLKLPDVEGKELVDQLEDIGRSVPFIIITGQGDERMAVEMMKRGALDYLVKDVQFQQFVPAVVRRALGHIERERRLAAVEEALRASERALKREHEFIATVLETSGALVVVLDCEGRIVRFNRACEQTSGYSADDVKGQRVLDLFILPGEREVVRTIFEKLCAGEFPSHHESYWLTRSGDRRWIAWSNNALLDGQGKVEYVISAGIDITEHKRLESEVLRISELEQRRIGQDLHDGPCQYLAGIELLSQVLEENLAKKSKSAAAQAGKIAEHVREAISQTRMLARGLSPVMREGHGLMSALQEFATHVEKLFKVSCQWHCQKPVLVNDHSMAIHLYRIAQEAVNNAVKHGRARHIIITLESMNARIVLTVRDDGRGFPETVPETDGMGLRIMQYRARMIGGSLAIQPQNTGGTVVSCSVYHPAHSEDGAGI